MNHDFQTGDILLFTHQPDYSTVLNSIISLMSKTIQWITNSKYSHAAIIVKDPSFTDPPLKGLYILESNCEDFKESENAQYKVGVELSSLDTILKEYKGQIYWRKLECTRDDEFRENIKEVHSTVHNRLYDFILTDWLKAAVHLYKGKTQRIKTFWCSALVSYVYVQLGFLDKKTPWSLISPEQLGTEHSNELEFKNCTLKKEELIYDSNKN